MTTAHETSDAFSEATLKEQLIFQRAKEAEMKDMLGSLADGHIEMYKSVCTDAVRDIQVTQPKLIFFFRPSRNGRELYLSYNGYE